MGATTVTLWKAESSGYYWLVDATMSAKGDVSICSGDQHHEWYAIIRAEHVAQLQSALADGDERLSERSVLDQLVARFGNRAEERGPFEAIKQFLDAHAVPWVSQRW
jgi:hypothetical protein